MRRRGKVCIFTGQDIHICCVMSCYIAINRAFKLIENLLEFRRKSYPKVAAIQRHYSHHYPTLADSNGAVITMSATTNSACLKRLRQSW